MNGWVDGSVGVGFGHAYLIYYILLYHLPTLALPHITMIDPLVLSGLLREWM